MLREVSENVGTYLLTVGTGIFVLKLDAPYSGPG
jgi:hypothetical protein